MPGQPWRAGRGARQPWAVPPSRFSRQAAVAAELALAALIAVKSCQDGPQRPGKGGFETVCFLEAAGDCGRSILEDGCPEIVHSRLPRLEEFLCWMQNILRGGVMAYRRLKTCDGRKQGLLTDWDKWVASADALYCRFLDRVGVSPFSFHEVTSVGFFGFSCRNGGFHPVSRV